MENDPTAQAWVDLRYEAYIGKVVFHTLGGYLSCGCTAVALSPLAEL